MYKNIGEYIKKLKNNRLFIFGCLFSIYCILLPLLVNNKPLIVKVNNTWHFPIFLNLNHEQSIINGDIILPLCYYLPTDLDYNNTNYVSPFQKNELSLNLSSKKHWLGTDHLGRDVFSMFCYGAKNSIIISFFSVFFSGVIGICIGLVLGYYQENEKISILKKCCIMASSIYVFYLFISIIFYSPFIDEFNLSICIISLSIISILFLFIRYIIPFIELRFMLKMNVTHNTFNKFYFIISTLNIIPNLLIYVFILSYIKPTMVNLIIVFTFTNFSDIALIIRAEVLRLKNNLYIEACYALGYSKWRIMTKHILINLWTSIVSLCALNVSTIILIESGLSFLGLGLTQDTTTIGTLLNTTKNNIYAWWITVPCILFIFFVSLFFNSLRNVDTQSKI